jgi:hypothetical protein
MTRPGSAEVVKLARWPPFGMAPAPSGLLFGGSGIPARRATSACGDPAFAEEGMTGETPIKLEARIATSLFMINSFDFRCAQQREPLNFAVAWHVIRFQAQCYALVLARWFYIDDEALFIGGVNDPPLARTGSAQASKRTRANTDPNA